MTSEQVPKWQKSLLGILVIATCPLWLAGIAVFLLSNLIWLILVGAGEGLLDIIAYRKEPT